MGFPFVSDAYATPRIEPGTLITGSPGRRPERSIVDAAGVGARAVWSSAKAAGVIEEPRRTTKSAAHRFIGGRTSTLRTM